MNWSYNIKNELILFPHKLKSISYVGKLKIRISYINATIIYKFEDEEEQLLFFDDILNWIARYTQSLLYENIVEKNLLKLLRTYFEYPQRNDIAFIRHVLQNDLKKIDDNLHFHTPQNIVLPKKYYNYEKFRVHTNEKSIVDQKKKSISFGSNLILKGSFIH